MMRIAVSNIAWDVVEDDVVAELLVSRAIDAIDVAPTKYFPAGERVSPSAVDQVRRWWKTRGIEITGMQSLLFGTEGLSVFGTAAVRQRTIERLTEVAAIARDLGATRLVFGSPKNRDRGTLADDAVDAIAIPFFNSLGDVAAAHGVSFCIEPNPARYGCNFLTTSAETALFVRRVAHPAIAMQLDTGSLTISNENAERIIRDNADIIGHVHVSEPDLVPIGDGPVHDAVAATLRDVLPGHVATIEMLATRDETHVGAIARAIGATQRLYLDA